MRYNASMAKRRKEARLVNEEARSLRRRLRFPFYTALCTCGAAFVAIPLAFEAINPITPYADIPMPQVERTAQIATPVPRPSPTLYALFPAAEPGPDASAAPAEGGVQAPLYPVLALGNESPHVASIQLQLMNLGYMDGAEPTQLFGEQTQAALQRFQRAHYMAQSGVADELTQSILFSADAKPYALEQGNEGSDVSKLQKQLRDLQYYEDKTNGYFGVATTRALCAFQTKNKLDASGIADGETLDVLYSSQARPKIDPTPTPKPKPTRTPRPESTPRPGRTESGNASEGSGGGSIAQVGSGVEAFISVAMSQDGKPYVYGDEGPNSYDCSGLVYYCLRSVGVKTGRMSAKNFAVVESWQTVPSKAYLQRGDLLFFTNSAGAGVIGHAGIYLGNNKYIHASSTAGRVLVSSWSDWSDTNFQWGKRVF